MSKVFYCFDCDEFDTKPEDKDFLQKVRQYCAKNDYELIWFCKDIEQVYLGRKVVSSQKKNEAATFKAKKLIQSVDAKKFSAATYKVNTSNILNVLDRYLKRR